MRYLISLIFLITACSPYHKGKVADDSNPIEEKRVCLAPAAEGINESGVDLTDLAAQLAGNGLGGRMHGVVLDQALFVFTWRQPGSFFVNVSLPMISEDAGIMQKIKEMKRHDRLVIKGQFIQNDAPIKHIKVTEIVEFEKWVGVGSDYDYDHKTSISTEILTKKKVKAKVHTIANGGSTLVIEFGDIVVPVFNKNPDLAKGLYRNDKIELKFKTLSVGAGVETKHLMIDTELKEPVCILEKTLTGHGEPIELTGPLVFFAKSPQIRTNVYALRVEDSDGIKRNYTIVPQPEDPDKFAEMFFEMIGMFDDVWKNMEDSAKYDRNKFINRKITVKIKGKKNVVSPNQANPQIYIKNLDDIEVIKE